MPTPNGTSQHPIRRALISAAFYGSLLAAALWLAYDIRFLDGFKFGSDTTVQEKIFANRPMALLWAIPLKLVLLIAFGQFKGILYYFRLRDALRLGAALLFSSIAIYLIVLSGLFVEIPRGVLLIDFNLSLIFCMIFRTGIRVWKEATDKSDEGGTIERIAIVGAGSAGAQLAADIQSRRGHGLKTICFLDDDTDKHGLEIHGLPVLGTPEQLAFLKDRLELTEVILALPTVSARRIREVTAICAENGLRTLVVPSLRELATGRVRTSDIRPVSLEDLLGRMPAQLDEHAIDSIAEGRVVLVSGAGGSIGSEIARQIAARRPARLLILDQCEVLLYQVEQDLINMGYGAVITPLVADVTDVSRMDAIFAKYRPGLVLHAAAHKHVPMMESQPGEAIKNNCLGTENAARLASKYEAERFVLIATDKAINPTNAMGASKRLAEIAMQSHQARPGNKTRFMAVRFGNVLGSSGSVIPLFRKQIAAGGPVTVTHPDVQRYFMTIPEAVGLVLQSAALGSGGEIFVLDMGEPLRIMDVARQLIELSGFKPDIDIEIKVVGLRPGEKLFEELQHRDESFAPTPHPRVFRFVSKSLPWDELEGFLARVRELAFADRDSCKLGIQQLVPEYTPYIE